MPRKEYYWKNKKRLSAMKKLQYRIKKAKKLEEQRKKETAENELLKEELLKGIYAEDHPEPQEPYKMHANPW